MAHALDKKVEEDHKNRKIMLFRSPREEIENESQIFRRVGCAYLKIPEDEDELVPELRGHRI
jgi:hypothetical protein